MRVSMRSAYESVQTEADIPDISILVRIGHFYFDLTRVVCGLTTFPLMLYIVDNKRRALSGAAA
jgi:hypothetical protein